MPSPPTIDVEALLAPIPGDDPAGVWLRYEPKNDPEYDKINRARLAEDQNLPQGEWKKELKVADWDEVVDLCVKCLGTKTKDLQIAAWLAEALTKLHGFAGLRDGLFVLGGIQKGFWESYYPRVEDKDLETRHGPFIFLNDPTRGLPFLIRTITLTRGADDQGYNYFQYQQSRETDNLIKKDPAKEKEILAKGRLSSKQFDAAVAQTPKAFYAQLCANLAEARQAFLAFESDTDERFKADSPSMLKVGDALAECVKLVDPILAAKRLADPDPEPIPEEVPAPPIAEGESSTSSESASGPAPSPAGGLAFDGVAVPRRRMRLGTPQEAEAPDFGRVLIEFRERAQALAEAGGKLAENRKKYGELLAELKRLDDEYEALSALVSRGGEAYQLLARLLKAPN